MNRFVLDFEKPIRELEVKISELEVLGHSGEIEIEAEVTRLRRKAEKLRRDVYSRLSRWQCVQLARHPMRPYSLDYIERIVVDFIELHGDRSFRDDPAIVAGFGRWGGRRVAVIGHQKGRGTRDNIFRNFGMPHPEGYRKALRIMKIAEKFGLPIVTLIDTPGAYPGLGAEERGQASAIADNLFQMAQLKVPTVAVVIGEGGSGGALALGVVDRVLMMRYAIYSVISPEGCASILYRDAAQAPQAAEALRLTANDLMEYELIDAIVEEPPGGAHNNYNAAATAVAANVNDSLNDLAAPTPEERIESRVVKYSKMGRWIE